MKNIMVQGTTSSAGKSIVTTALCRILANNGKKVAPFKSQNMTRKSVNIGDGKEIAGSQVIQSEAAKTEPVSQMNPILLMPRTDTGSCVVINGVRTEEISASEYHCKKKEYMPVVKKAYEELRDQFDFIVIEGAGSPAEINLRKDDFVNMGLAHMVDAPVILVGDIDRGGVFASIYGTLKILDKEDSERIKGFIVNKFRGDISLLEPGIKELEEKLDIPCLGVIPYLDINIEEEDSLVDGKAGRRIEDDFLREREYDKLAESISSHLDMKKIYEIIGD